MVIPFLAMADWRQNVNTCVCFHRNLSLHTDTHTHTHRHTHTHTHTLKNKIKRTYSAVFAAVTGIGAPVGGARGHRVAGDSDLGLGADHVGLVGHPWGQKRTRRRETNQTNKQASTMSVKASSTVNTAPHLLRLGAYRGGRHDARPVEFKVWHHSFTRTQAFIPLDASKNKIRKSPCPFLGLYDHHLVEMGKKTQCLTLGRTELKTSKRVHTYLWHGLLSLSGFVVHICIPAAHKIAFTFKAGASCVCVRGEWIE